MIVLIIILFAIFNAQVINWQQNKTTSKGWHSTSFILRGCLILQAESIGLAFIYAFISWAGYNVIINLIMEQKWNYFGKYDFVKGWVYWGINFIALLTGLYLIL